MRRSPGFVAGAALAAVLALPAADAAAPGGDAAQLLRQADAIKASDNPAFRAIVAQLTSRPGLLQPRERHWLDYLQAWQLGHDGRYGEAIAALDAVIDEARDDAALRYRAGLTLIEDQAMAGRYRDAYARLADALDARAGVADSRARMHVYAVASRLYEAAGQDGLALDYAQRWLAEDSGAVAHCEGRYLELVALHDGGRLDAHDGRFEAGIDACRSIGDAAHAQAIRDLQARVVLEGGKPRRAEALLESPPQAAASASARARLALLARCYLQGGKPGKARSLASRVVDAGAADGHSQVQVEALDVLWRVAKAQGDYASALALHERFATAQRHLLADARSRAVAYQEVHQKVLERKRELDALGEKNQLLRLQQQVIEKSAESERLYILLLLLVIAFVVLWTYRVKRSQKRFQRLARRDSLTGIVNRQHFMDEAKALLNACARSSREVCLILVDLDNFKRVNDTHGHVAGDGVLKQTVEMFQLHMRVDDLFGRLGGEEFGIMLPDCRIETALGRAEELRVAIAGFAHAGVEITVSASFGVASTRESGYELRQLLIHSDDALYRAKRAGRDRVERYAATDADPA